MRSVAVNIPVQVAAWTHFISLGYILGGDIAGSYGSSLFNLLKKYQTVFPSSCTMLHFHQQCVRVSISPPPCQHLLLSDYLIMIILVGMTWYLIVVLICISLIAYDVEHLFLCLLAICVSFLKNCLSGSFAHFKIRFSFCY